MTVKGRIVLDFENCKGMDSTFLGILAGTALELRKQTPAGVLILSNLGERNHELVCNLGLQNLLTIAEEIPENCDTGSAAEFSALKNVKISDAKNVLQRTRRPCSGGHRKRVEVPGCYRLSEKSGRNRQRQLT